MNVSSRKLRTGDETNLLSLPPIAAPKICSKITASVPSPDFKREVHDTLKSLRKRFGAM